MRSEIQAVLKLAHELTPEELAKLMGELEEVRFTVWVRMTSIGTKSPVEARMLDVAEASRLLGVSADYLYRHHRSLPFAQKMGRRLLFSSTGIDRYIREQGGLALRRR